MKVFAIRAEPLNEQRKQALKVWLAKPELDILLAVIAARARLAEQNAVDQAHKSIETADTPERSALVASLLGQSARYHGAVALLEEIRSNPAGWETITLKS